MGVATEERPQECPFRSWLLIRTLEVVADLPRRRTLIIIEEGGIEIATPIQIQTQIQTQTMIVIF